MEIDSAEQLDAILKVRRADRARKLLDIAKGKGLKGWGLFLVQAAAILWWSILFRNGPSDSFVWVMLAIAGAVTAGGERLERRLDALVLLLETEGALSTDKITPGPAATPDKP